MGIKKTILLGVIAGVVMGIALFFVGAIAGRLVYGPQMAPSGKFEPEQMNAFYFLWTKVAMGVFFGVLFVVLYGRLPLSKRIEGVRGGLIYAFFLWLVIFLWNISHPLVYDSVYDRDRLFWLIYTLGGFLAYGGTLGFLFKKLGQRLGLAQEEKNAN